MLTVRRAFVLAAGLGTRLKPFSDRIPKPAWPLFDRPIALHLIDALAGAGVVDFIVNLHHLPEQLRTSLETGMPEGAKVRWSFEERILGTGGALVPWLGEFSGEPFFLANADTHRSFNPAEMAASHEATDADATLSLVRLPEGEKGPIAVDAEGRIVRFLGAVSPEGGEPVAECGFTGVHVIGPRVMGQIARVAAEREKFCVNADVHSALVTEGARHFGFIPADGRWSDLGTPESYLNGHFAFLSGGDLPTGTGGELVTADREAPGGGRILAPSWLGDGAAVEAGGVVGPFAVLCPGAKVASGGVVARAVVWQGAVVVGEVSGIATGWGEAMDAGGKVRSIE